MILPPNDFILTVWGSFVTLALLIPFCRMDMKTRNISDAWMIAYFVIAFPSVFYVYTHGLLLTYFIFSVVMACVWLVIRKTGAWGGADTKFLMIYSLVAPLNPLNLYQWTFQLSFPVILGAVMLGVTVMAKGKKDLPLMLPISAAIIVAMVIGRWLP